MTWLDEVETKLETMQTIQLVGRVAQIKGLTLHVADLALPIGAMVRVLCQPEPVLGEVIGFEHDQVLVMLLGTTQGIRRGDRVEGVENHATAMVGDELLGRVLNGLGEPIDHKGPLAERLARPLQPEPIDPMLRVPISEPLGSGVRSIDAMLTVGRGQRLGIFAGPGVGKSTLLGMMARQTEADVSVIALIGERGREVQDFIQQSLGEEGLARSVVIVATGDEPALLRVRAAMYATSVAEYFRDQGKNVVLMMDSVTRFCQAQRQIGLAAGEPPTTKGFTPSVFALLPILLERTGRTANGSITGLYTILVEGDDLTEPISDAARGILDGHIILSRELSHRGHWPAIDVLQSVSRVATDVIDHDHQTARITLGRVMNDYQKVEELVNIGAYATGSNSAFDLAIAMQPFVEELLCQTNGEQVGYQQARSHLLVLCQRMDQYRQNLAGQTQENPMAPLTTR